jgi:hypothetical protein
MANRIRLRVVLVIAVGAACCLSGISLPAHAQSPLYQQRQKQASTPGGPTLSGRVVSVLDGIIYTSIVADWSSAGISDGTVLSVRLAGRTFNARFLSPAHYSEIATDPAARKGLDVDIACTLDQTGALVVVGLGGGLPEWLGIKPGATVSLERR